MRAYTAADLRRGLVEPSLPGMSERLAELRRQRALMQEHLAWLDREIAQLERTETRAPLPKPATPTPISVTPAAADPFKQPMLSATQRSSDAVPGTGSASADAILEQYRVEPGSLKSDVRKGCFLYFAAAFVLLALGIAVLWLAFRR